MDTTPLEFSLDYYIALLRGLLAGGYTFGSFLDGAVRPGVCLLRHDVDKSVGYALRMARAEAELGIRAHYFFLLHTPLYNVAETETWQQVREIGACGHVIGLHYDERRALGPSGRLDGDVMREVRWLRALVKGARPVVSFHNPSSLPIRRVPSRSYVSTYAPEFFPPRLPYLSDSNRHLREPALLDKARRRAWPRLQLLIHPVWWFHPALSVEAVLRRVVQERVAQVDRYLTYTNHVWEQGGAKRLSVRRIARPRSAGVR